MGQIFNDPTGHHNNGEYIRISNISYLLAYDETIIIATSSCQYRLPRSEEKKNE